MINALETLCEDGHPEAVVELVEYAYTEANKAVEYVDDSDGWLLDIGERLSELHFLACEQSSVDPVESAGRLLQLELNSELEGFDGSADNYAELLGAEGLAAFRAELEPLWNQINTDDDTAHDKSFTGIYRIKTAMYGWARGTGDPDIVIETYERGLSRRQQLNPDSVLDIAQVLMRAGREDEAIAWAQRGIAENSLSYRHTDDLRDFLTGALRRRGDDEAAEKLHWQAFTDDPSVSTYRRLLKELGTGGGNEVGTGTGDEWQQRCVDTLRSYLTSHKPDDSTSSISKPSRVGISKHVSMGTAAETLIDILLYEGRADDAWVAAEEFGCQPQTRLILARAREKRHPLDAIEVYEPEIFEQINRTKTSAYRSAVKLMDRVRQLADTVGKPELFQLLLKRVRTEHPRKRSLHKLLNDKQW